MYIQCDYAQYSPYITKGGKECVKITFFRDGKLLVNSKNQAYCFYLFLGDYLINHKDYLLTYNSICQNLLMGEIPLSVDHFFVLLKKYSEVDISQIRTDDCDSIFVKPFSYSHINFNQFNESSVSFSHIDSLIKINRN